MKVIFNRLKEINIMNKLSKTIFSFVVLFGLVIVLPGSYTNVYAAPLEDCDLDGFDDATGVPVPWPGYDETKGDTPDGPGGAKIPTIVPNTDTNNATSGNTKNETSDKIEADQSDSKTSTDSVKNSSDSTENTSKTDSDKTKSNDTKSSTTDNSSNGEKNQTDKTQTDKSSTTVKASTGKVETGISDSNAKDNENKTQTVTSINNTEEDSVEVVDGSINSSTSNESNIIETSDDIQEEEIVKEEIVKEEGTAEGLEDSEEGVVSIIDDNIKMIVNAKGLIEIIEADGRIIHAGSSLIISGTGFASNINELELEIQSDLIPLGYVETSEDGAFETTFELPRDLKPGVHNIVVRFEGEEITRQEFEVGPKAADSFLQALLVGFTKDNKGLVPGLLILFSLLVAGGGVLGTNALIHARHQNKTKNK